VICYMAWTKKQNDLLFYHIHRVCVRMKEQKKANYDPKVTCDSLRLLLEDKYDGEKVIKATIEIIHKKSRIPLSLEIERFINGEH